MNISPTVKRILLGVLFAAAVGAIMYLLYALFFRAPETTTVNENTNQEVTALPNLNDLLANVNTSDSTANDNLNTALPGPDATAQGALTKATSLTPNVETRNPAVSTDGSLRYYNPQDGGFYKVDDQGNIVQLGDKRFPSASNVTWAPTSNDVIIEFPDSSNVYYDIKSGEQVTLPAEFNEFDFSPTSSQIAFKYEHPDPDRRVIATASPDGSSATTIEELGIYGDRATIDWSPTGKVVAHYSEFSGVESQDVGFIGLKNENFRGMTISGRGLQTQYSPDGLRMLYSTYSGTNGYIPTVKIVDTDGNDIGKNNQHLSLQTFADKCAFSEDSDTVFCGVPAEPQYGMGLSPFLAYGQHDEIYKVDLKTGVQSRVAVPADEEGNAEYRVDEMFVVDNDSAIVFQDGNTGELIRIEL